MKVMGDRSRLVAAGAISMVVPLALVGSCGGEVITDFSNQHASDAGRARDVATYPFDAPTSTDDAGPPPIGADNFVKAWMKSPWTGDCALYQPANDAQLAAVPPFHWNACTSGRAGCLELAPDWPATGYHQLVQPSERVTSSGSIEVMTRREYAVHLHEFVIWDSLLGMEAAWRYDGDETDCLQALGDISSGEDGLTVMMRSGSDQFSEYRQIFGSAPEMRAKTLPDYTLTPTDVADGNPLYTSSASASTVAMDDELGVIAVRDRSSNQLTILPDRQASYDTLVGDSDFFATSTALYAWTESHGVELLRTPTTGAYLHDLSADESTLIWLESTNFDSPSAVTNLYTSPFASTLATFAPHAVMTIPCSEFCESKMSDGYAVVGLDSLTVNVSHQLLLRLSDGAYWNFDAEPGPAGIGKFLNGEIWLSGTAEGGDSIIRISLASLGAPLGD